jgi:hypothetical protein
MASTRTQLTLFADPDEAAAIERLRAEHDPVQHGLIACHVTLCREDELVELERVTEKSRVVPTGTLPRRILGADGLYRAPFEHVRWFMLLANWRTAS